MKKKGLICYLLSILLCFSSCFKIERSETDREDSSITEEDIIEKVVVGISKIIGFKTDEELQEETLNNLTTAIINRDSEALKGLFSKKSVEEDLDFDENMEKLFDFFKETLCLIKVSGEGWTVQKITVAMRRRGLYQVILL